MPDPTKPPDWMARDLMQRLSCAQCAAKDKRIAELAATLAKLATWWGGADHRRDECPEEENGAPACGDCLMADSVNAALEGIEVE